MAGHLEFYSQGGKMFSAIKPETAPVPTTPPIH